MAAFENRVPETVWLIIFVVAIFQAFATGFSLKRRFWFSLVMTPLVIGMVMALLADLDSPRTGLIHIEQNSNGTACPRCNRDEAVRLVGGDKRKSSVRDFMQPPA